MPSFKDIDNVTYTSRDIADKLINTQLSGVQGQDLVLTRRQNTSQTGSVLMSNILNRANHTDTQAISTIDNLQQTLDSKITNIYTQQGSLIKSNSLNQPEELKIGTIGQILTSDGTNPLWLNIPISSESSQGIITIANQVETDTGTNDEKAITPLKLRNSSLATTTQKGVTQLATQTEYFNKDNTKAITASNVYNDVSKTQFHIFNTITGLTQAVAPNGSYNILTAMLESAETQVGNIPVIFKTVGNVTQNKLLNQTTDVIILPSPLYTYNVTYTKYNVFVSCVLDIPVIPNNKVIELYIVIRRVDNSQVARSAPFTYTPTNALAGTRLDVECSSGLMPIFVNGESDVLCNTGFRVFIESAAYSDVNITLKSSSIIIFRN